MERTNNTELQRAMKFASFSIAIAILWVVVLLLAILADTGRFGIEFDLLDIDANILLFSCLGLPTIGFILSIVITVIDF